MTSPVSHWVAWLETLSKSGGTGSRLLWSSCIADCPRASRPKRTDGSWREKQALDGAANWRRCLSECFHSKRLLLFWDVPWHSCITNNKDKSGIKQTRTWKHFPALWVVFWVFCGFFPPTSWKPGDTRRKLKLWEKLFFFFCTIHKATVCWRLKRSRMQTEQSCIWSSKSKKVILVP